MINVLCQNYSPILENIDIDDDEDQRIIYNCNICFDTAFYPVLITCGHLYCWRCLALWIKNLDAKLFCPTCKKECYESEDIIPVYGRGSQSEKNFKDSESLPKRPSGKQPKALNFQYTRFNISEDQLNGFQLFSRHFIISTEENRVFPTYYLTEGNPPTFIIETGQLGFLSRLILMFICLDVIMSIFN